MGRTDPHARPDLLVTHAAPTGRCHGCQSVGPRQWAVQPLQRGSSPRVFGCVRRALCRHCLGMRPHRSLL